MSKQVQLIRYNAGLGLFLTLALINPLAVQAGTRSDKTQWLTNNLERATPAKQTTLFKSERSSITLKALPAREDRRASINSITVTSCEDASKVIKLRPFLANRKLPSRRELESALVEQKAKLAEQETARLSGQVSTFVVGNDNSDQALNTPFHMSAPQARIYQASSRNATNRAYTRSLATKSAPQGFSFMRRAEQQLLSSMMPHEANTSSVNAPVLNTPVTSVSLTNTPALTQAATTMQATDFPVANFPATSLPMMAAPLMNSSSSAMPSGFPSDPIQFNTTQASGFGSAGPPPFPLNLLPEAALKQLIRSLACSAPSHNNNAPKTFFGCWHNNSRLGDASHIGSWHNDYQTSNLPYAGFQSHLHPVHLYTTQRISTYRISALPVVTASPIKSDSSNKNTSSNKKDTTSNNRILRESQVRVATYPAYATQSLKPWNFAQ